MGNEIEFHDPAYTHVFWKFSGSDPEQSLRGPAPKTDSIGRIDEHDCVRRLTQHHLEKFRSNLVIRGRQRNFFLAFFFFAAVDFFLAAGLAVAFFFFPPNAELQFSEYFLVVPLRKIVIVYPEMSLVNLVGKFELKIVGYWFATESTGRFNPASRTDFMPEYFPKRKSNLVGKIACQTAQNPDF